MKKQNAFSLVRLSVVVAVVSVLGACSASATSPDTQSRAPRTPSAAQHDNTPPDTPCASGWTLIDGRWVCPGI